MSKCSRINRRSLWPIWFTALTFISNGYLIYRSAYQLIRPTEQPVRLAFTILAAVITPLTSVAVAVLWRTYTNDGLPVGFGLLSREFKSSKNSTLKRFYRGLPPIAPLLYVISSYLLLSVEIYEPYQLYSEILGNTTEFELLLTKPSTIPRDITQVPNSLEFANFLAALLIYNVKYCTVFWRPSRTFAVLFGCVLVLSSTIHSFAYFGYRALYTSIDKVGESPFILSRISLTALYITSNTILVLSMNTIFHHGYQLVIDRINNYTKRFGSQYDLMWTSSGYTAHFFALLSVVLFVGCNGPIIYDYITLNFHERNILLIFHLSFCVVFMLVWVTLWLIFTVKQKWQIDLNEQTIKRLALSRSLCNHQPVLPPDETVSHHFSDPISQPSPIGIGTEISGIEHTDDQHSNSTISISDPHQHSSTSSVLSQALRNSRRSNAEQKVTFQDATKIVIETNLDSDLDTIPESDVEQDDSALYTGSGSSNEETHEQIIQPKVIGRSQSHDPGLHLSLSNPPLANGNPPLTKGMEKTKPQYGSLSDLQKMKGTVSNYRQTYTSDFVLSTSTTADNNLLPRYKDASVLKSDDLSSAV